MCRKLFLLVCFVLVLGLVGNAWAEIYSEDVGAPALPGSSAEVSGVWTVDGDGTGIVGPSDQFHFVYQRMDGDCSLEVNLTGLDPGARAGVMIRRTLDGDSAHATMSATLSSIAFQFRPVAGGPTLEAPLFSEAVPERLRITRQGDLLRGEYYYVYPPYIERWEPLGLPITIPMDDCVYIGLVVTSNSSTALATGVFEEVAWTGTPCAPPEPERKATEPSPMPGAEDVPINPILTWEPGEGAIYHLVSFSSNFDDVNNIAVLDLATGTSYDPGILNLTETYYWAVHTMWQGNPDFGLAMGDIWSFTVTDHILLEDFEAYNVPPEVIPDQNVTVDSYVAVYAVSPPNQVVVDVNYTVVAAAPDDVNHLLAYYSFDANDANDSSGNEHHGTEMMGGSNDRWPTYEDSKAGLGRAIRFYDDGDHVADDDAGDYMNGLSELTWSAWIKSEKTDRDEGWIIGDDYQWSDRRAMRYDRKGGDSKELRDVIKYGVATTEGNEEDESYGEVQTTDWQHVAMTWKSGVGITLYLDGVLDIPGENKPPKGGVTDGYTKLLIGRGSKDNSDDESWNGLVDEVRIYNIALSYGEVRYLAGELDNLEIPTVYGPLIAGYNFDTDASDTSGNDNHGTLAGDASVSGGELYVDGDNDCVDIGHSARFNPESGPFSISVWINIEEWKNSWAGIVTKRGENSRGWQLRRSSGSDKLCFTVRGTSAGDDMHGNIAPTLGEWHHVAAVWDPDAGKRTIYQDGQIDRQIGDSGTVRWMGHNVYIGGRARKDNRIWNGVDAEFKGSIDDVQIYDYALTEGNVREMAGVGNLVIPDRYGPMIAHYTFDAENADDSSGNNRHGVEHGGPGYVASDLGKAIELDGGQDVTITGFIEIQDNDELSIAMWVKPDTLNGQRFMWFTHESSGYSKLRCYIRDGEWRFKAGDGSDNREIEADATAGEWTHYAGVRRNGDKIYLYINGVLEDQTSFSGPAGLQSNSWIGSEGGGNKFDGCIDDVRIYDVALSHGQIVDLAVDSPNPLADTWTDSGELVSSLETWGAYEAHQAMRLDVNGVGEVRRDSPFEDWTLANIKALVLYVKGDPGNALDDLYMGLSSAVGGARTAYLSYPGDINDLKIAEWSEWNVDLAALASAPGEKGVPLPHIEELAFGATGTGTLTFDYLTLWTTRCVPKYGPYADITDDCVVDYKDMRVLAGDWLEADYAIYPQEPDTANLVAYWPLDVDFNDYSGNGFDGTPMGGATIVADATRGNVLSLDKGDYVNCGNPPALNFGTNDWTLSAWVKNTMTGTGDSNKGTIIGNGGDTGGGKRYCLIQSEQQEGEVTLVTDDDSKKRQARGDDTKVNDNTWHHVLGVRDGGTIRIYIDGVEEGSSSINEDLSGTSQHNLYLGCITDNPDPAALYKFYDGLIDEVRIYNYAVNELERLWLVTETDRIYHPIVSDADLSEDEPEESRYVNFKDYGVIADEWLLELLFP